MGSMIKYAMPRTDSAPSKGQEKMRHKNSLTIAALLLDLLGSLNHLKVIRP